MLKWLNRKQFEVHSLAFLLMLIASVGMILTMQNESNGFSWVMIVIFAAANVLTLFVK